MQISHRQSWPAGSKPAPVVLTLIPPGPAAGPREWSAKQAQFQLEPPPMTKSGYTKTQTHTTTRTCT